MIVLWIRVKKLLTINCMKMEKMMCVAPLPGSPARKNVQTPDVMALKAGEDFQGIHLFSFIIVAKVLIQKTDLFILPAWTANFSE